MTQNQKVNRIPLVMSLEFNGGWFPELECIRKFDLIKKGPKFCNKLQKHKSIIKSTLDASKFETESHSIGYVTGIQRWMVPRTGLYT